MINIDVLKGFQPRFRNYNEEEATPGQNGYDCSSNTIPVVDGSSVECLEFISTNCIKTSKSYNFFGIGTLETLTSALDKIMLKMKAVSEKASKAGRGIATFVQLTEPTQHTFNTIYGNVEGFGVNKINGADTIKAGDIWIVE